MDELLTIHQVAEFLKVSRMTVYRYIKKGKLPAYKAGRDYRIKKMDLDLLLKRHSI